MRPGPLNRARAIAVALSAIAPLAGCDGSGSSSALDSGVDDGGTDAATDLGSFVFSTAPATHYAPADRVGFAGTSLLFLLSDASKDWHNESAPEADAVAPSDFSAEVATALETWLLGAPGMQTTDVTGLSDDLRALGIEPCVPPPFPSDSCDDQVRQLITPDVIAIRTDLPSDLVGTGSFNGRRLTDPVVDFLLARAWVDLALRPADIFFDGDEDGTPGPSFHPRANDASHSTSFPYLAPAHALELSP